MNFYFVLAIIPILFYAFFHEKKKYLFFVFGVLAFFACLRGANVGTDTESYLSTYQLVKSYGMSGFGASHSVEYGYFGVVWLLSRFFSNPQVEIIFFTGITYIVLAYIIYKHSNNIVMSSFLFVVWVMPSTMNGMRQHFAFALVLLSICFMLEKKTIKAFLLICLAVTFHNSALIFFPFLVVYYVLKKWPGVKGVMIMGLCFALSSFFVDSIVLLISRYVPRYAGYLTSSYYDKVKSTNTIWIVIYVVFIIFYLIIRKNKERWSETKDEYLENANVYYFLLTILHIIVIVLSASTRGIFQRLSVYSEYGVIFLIPYVMNNIFIYSKICLTNRSIRLIKILFYVLFLAWDYIMLKQNPHYIIPYTFM